MERKSKKKTKTNKTNKKKTQEKKDYLKAAEKHCYLDESTIVRPMNSTASQQQRTSEYENYSTYCNEKKTPLRTKEHKKLL